MLDVKNNQSDVYNNNDSNLIIDPQLGIIEKPATQYPEPEGQELSADAVPEMTEPETQEQTNSDQNYPEKQPQHAKKSPADSFAELKAKANRLERERDEQMRRIAELEKIAYAQLLQQQQHANPLKQEALEEEEDLKIGDTDLAEGKHLSSLGRKIKQQNDRLEQTKQHIEGQLTEIKLRSKYPDVDTVLTLSNIQELSQKDPDIAEMLRSYKSNPFKQAEMTYKFIKQLGIAKDENETLHAMNREREQQAIARNVAKPRPSNIVDQSPLKAATAYAEGLTPELQAKLWQEMNEARSRY